MHRRNNSSNFGISEDDYESDSEPLLQFTMPTRNRFEQGHWRESDEEDSGWQQKVRKQKKGSSFKDLNTDDKLIKIYDQLNRNFGKIQSLEEKQGECMRGVQFVNRELSTTNSRVEKLEDAVRTLAYRSIDIEARSRRNNLIFYNITERSGLPEKRLITHFLEDELGIDTGDMCIDRAHRLGRIKHEVRRDGLDPKRPLIVKFRDYVDTEIVMGKVYLLKNLPFGVDRDYPREIADARKQLYTCDEAKRARIERKNVQVRYPARLYIDGSLVHDEFPEWFDIMGRNRIEQKSRRRPLDSSNHSGGSVSQPVLELGETQPTSSPRARDVSVVEKRQLLAAKKSRTTTQSRVDSSSRGRSRARSENINAKNNKQTITESQKVSTQVESVRAQRRKSKRIIAPNGGVSTLDQSHSSVIIDTQPGNSCDK